MLHYCMNKIGGGVLSNAVLGTKAFVCTYAIVSGCINRAYTNYITDSIVISYILVYAIHILDARGRPVTFWQPTC